MTFKILLLLGIFPLGWSPLILASVKPVTDQDSLILRANITDNHCLECHGVKGYAVPLGKHGDTPKKTLDVNIDNLRDSVHGKLTCLQCHIDIQQLPHRKDGLSPVDCIHCHQQLHRESTELIEELKRGRTMVGLIPSYAPTPSAVKQFTQDYTHSIHAQPRTDKPPQPNAECQACHGTHYVFPATDSRALSHRLASPEVCGQCHTKALAEYRGSVHGAALKTPWKGESAVCSDCHTAHQISVATELTARRIITEQCGNCHAAALASYMDSYHGQLAWLGGEKVAKCYDCHEAHDTRKIEDPAAKVNPTHLLKTCQECHHHATTRFIQFQPHANTRDFDKYPALWLVAKGMVVLVIIVLIFFYSHSLLWFYRSWQTRKLNHLHQAPLPANIDTHQHFQRFSWPWRVNHWLLALSVMTLVFTGMTVMYADSFWAINTVTILGGPENAATIHRIAAVIFLTAILGHLLALFYKLIMRRQGHFACITTLSRCYRHDWTIPLVFW
ncbi:MAG: hypothetical protein BWK78_04495 [Thiotrichaceae bacterium IS1]|nr:MAG: hypothetical protein BWK78_04495 [Thiotrichaceae bacterium IS1]